MVSNEEFIGSTEYLTL